MAMNFKKPTPTTSTAVKEALESEVKKDRTAVAVGAEARRTEGKKAGKAFEEHPGPFRFSISLGSKLPIPGIQYSSQEVQVTVSGDNFDETHAMAREMYEEVRAEHIRSFESAVRRGTVSQF